LGVHVTL